MNSELEKRIREAREKRDTAIRIKKKLDSVKKDLSQSTQRKMELAVILEKERRDVENLKHLSLANVFATIMGNKDEKLDKEQQEYLAARVEYETSQRVEQELLKQLKSLSSQMESLEHAEQEYQMLLKEKEEILKNKQNQAAGELFQLSEEEGRLQAREKELLEAREAAGYVLSSLGKVLNSLDSAAGWGIWDMLGGGLISTAIKHSKIDDARDAIADVQYNLRRLQRELKDVQMDTGLEINIDGCLTFADYFFDGIIVDWMVQSNINEALNRAREVNERVKRLKDRLEDELSQNASEMAQLRQRKEQLIEQTMI